MPLQLRFDPTSPVPMEYMEGNFRSLYDIKDGLELRKCARAKREIVRATKHRCRISCESEIRSRELKHHLSRF
jgi:hypothetical protein